MTPHMPRLAAVLALLTPLAACNSTPPEDVRVSSETHWLRACDTDEACGPYACVCGICTLRCERDDACDGDNLRCVVQGQNALGELCQRAQDTQTQGACLPRCDDAQGLACPTTDAPQALTCANDACIPPEALERLQKIDLLFVIDNSGSMCEEQAQLRLRADGLVQRLVQARVDFQAAVITTDMTSPTQQGRIQSTPDPNPGPACTVEVDISQCPDTLNPILRIDDPGYHAGAPLDAEAAQNLQRDLGCLFTVGTSGNGFERGLAAARAALSPERLANENAGLLRPDAHLAILFITDENDCSFNDDDIVLTNANSCEWERDKLTPTAAFVDAFRNVKAAPWRLLVAGIFAPDDLQRYDEPLEVAPACSSDLGTGYAGYRYQETIEALDGLALNICEDSLDTQLDLLIERIIDTATP